MWGRCRARWLRLQQAGRETEGSNKNEGRKRGSVERKDAWAWKEVWKEGREEGRKELAEIGEKTAPRSDTTRTSAHPATLPVDLLLPLFAHQQK